MVTLNAILGYTPTVPHWGYNGSARRYWDFLYGQVQQMSATPSLRLAASIYPVMAEYREHPEDFFSAPVSAWRHNGGHHQHRPGRLRFGRVSCFSGHAKV